LQRVWVDNGVVDYDGGAGQDYSGGENDEFPDPVRPLAPGNGAGDQPHDNDMEDDISDIEEEVRRAGGDMLSGLPPLLREKDGPNNTLPSGVGLGM
jgi:hypothetical protein